MTPSAAYAACSATSIRGLGLQGQRTFPAKTFPETCYGSDVWYPKCDLLVPHVISKFRTLVRPPTSPPLISYFSTPSQPLPTHIPNTKRERGRLGSPRPSATITSHPRRLRLSVARPSDGPTLTTGDLADTQVVEY